MTFLLGVLSVTEPKVLCPEQARLVLQRGSDETRRPSYLARGLVAVAFAACLVLWLVSPFGLPRSERQMFVVISGSMSPAVNTGDLIAIRPVEPHSIRVGDIVTFTDHDAPGLLITHRIIAVSNGNNGPVFTTKGDANPVPDRLPVAAAQVVGRLQYRIPYGGHLTQFLRTPTGRTTAMLLPVLLLMLTWRNVYATMVNRPEVT